MTISEQEPTSNNTHRDSPVLGMAFCIGSALAYTGAHVCLRKLAIDCDPVWVTCVKAAVSVAVLGPYLALRAFAGRAKLLPLRAIGVLIGAGLIAQFLGNLSLLWALRVVGLAVSMPTVFSMTILTSAVLGQVFLGERVSAKTRLAISVLLASIALLGLDVGLARPTDVTTGALAVVLGVGAAGLTGAAFASATVIIRHVVTNSVSAVAVVFTMTSVGLVCMSVLSVARLGVDALLETPTDDLAFMVAAGAFNLVGFLGLAKGLQLTHAVHANVLNASQVAMCAVAGVLVFSEPLTILTAAGVCLTIWGIVLNDRPKDQEAVATAE